MTFKLAVKTLAQKNGLHATFMPKPVSGAAGSGMHVNMSLFRDGKNAFYDEADPRHLSPLAYQFIAGLLGHVRGCCAVTNPLVNSYKRLVPGYEAPCHLAWSTGNRSALVRIPTPRGNSTRVELRSPDPACNPYLALAACLAAGLDGIEQQMTPPAPLTGNLYEVGDASGIQRLSGGGRPGPGGRQRHYGRARCPRDGAVSGRKASGVPVVRRPGVPVGAGTVSGGVLTCRPF